MTYTNVFNIGSKHIKLLRLVNFYEKEIELLSKLLADVIKKNDKLFSLPDAEHFQNLFIVHQNHINDLRHSINLNKLLTVKDAKYNDGNVEDHALIDENIKIENEVLSFEKSVMSLRHDFKKFMLKYI
jgi:hypothetical protein